MLKSFGAPADTVREEDLSMDELVALRRKIAASRRIIARESQDPCRDPIVEKMVIEELQRRLPELERRERQLVGYLGTERDRRKS